MQLLRTLLPPSLKQELHALSMSGKYLSWINLTTILGFVFYAIAMAFLLYGGPISPTYDFRLPFVCLGVWMLATPMLRAQMQLVKSLRKQSCPWQNAGVFLVLRWSLILWLFACALYCSRDGHLASILLCSIALSLAIAYTFTSDSAELGGFLLIFQSARPHNSPDWALIPWIVFWCLITALLIRDAVKNWQRRELTIATQHLNQMVDAPRIIGPIEPLANAMASPAEPTKLKVHSQSPPFGLVLNYFGFTTSPWLLLHSISIMFLILCILLLAKGARTPLLVALVMMVTLFNLCNAPTRFFALYQSRAERSFLNCLPGLPNAPEQAAYLQRAYWWQSIPRLALPMGLVFPVTLVFELNIAPAFFIAAFASALLAAALMQGFLSIYAQRASHALGAVWVSLSFMMLMVIWVLAVSWTGLGFFVGGWWISSIYAVAAALVLQQCLKPKPALALCLRH